MVYVLLAKRETPVAKRGKWKNNVTINKQGHDLVNVTKAHFAKTLLASGRKKALRVKYKGKTYPALPWFGKSAAAGARRNVFGNAPARARAAPGAVAARARAADEEADRNVAAQWSRWEMLNARG
jgi:hypothetical protein